MKMQFIPNLLAATLLLGCSTREQQPKKATEPAQWVISTITDKSGNNVGINVIHGPLTYPVKGRPHLVYVTFDYTHRPLPSKEEMKAFPIIEGKFEVIEKACSAQLVGIWTQNGKRDYIFYASDEKLFEDQVRKAVGSTHVNIATEFDPNWTQYADLLEMLQDAKPAGP